MFEKSHEVLKQCIDAYVSKGDVRRTPHRREAKEAYASILLDFFLYNFYYFVAQLIYQLLNPSINI